MPSSASQSEPIGELLRSQRVGVVGKGLREMARMLDIAPAHLTDIEKGRRTPSEELLVRISQHYKLPIAQLRAGWQRAESIVDEVANQDTTTAEKVPEFLRTARNLTPEQWDKLIREANHMSGTSQKPRDTRKPGKPKGGGDA